MSDFSLAFTSGLWPQAFPDRSACYLTEAMEISRFSSIECPRMHRVSDSAGPGEDSLANVLLQCCLPPRTTWSASRMGDFGAQWLAYAFPCQLHHV